MSGTRNLTGICQDIHRNRANVDTPTSGPSTSSRSGRYYRRLSQVKSFLHHEMERGCKLSGVKKIRIHDLRHSHISHLIDLGFSAVAIADRVGHESIDITYRYSHLFPSKQVAMADRLDAVNASFEDCEDQDDDVEIMQTEETAPMIDMDAAAEKIISIDKYKAV